MPLRTVDIYLYPEYHYEDFFKLVALFFSFCLADKLGFDFSYLHLDDNVTGSKSKQFGVLQET